MNEETNPTFTGIGEGVPPPASPPPLSQLSPARKAPDKQAVLDALKETMDHSIATFGRDAGDAARKVQSFLQRMEPDLEHAIALAATGEHTHVNTIRMMYDRFVGYVTEVFETWSYEQKITIATGVLGVMRGFVAAAF